MEIRGCRGDSRGLNLHGFGLVFKVGFWRAARILVLLLVLPLGDVLVLFVVNSCGPVRLGSGRSSASNNSNTTGVSAAAATSSTATSAVVSTSSTVASSSTSYPTPRIARVEMIPRVMLMMMLLWQVMVRTRLWILVVLLLRMLRLLLLLWLLLLLLWRLLLLMVMLWLLVV